MPYIVERNRVITINQNTTHNSSDKQRYQMNDLSSVFTHYDKNKGCNVTTPNELPNNKLNGGINNNGKSS